MRRPLPSSSSASLRKSTPLSSSIRIEAGWTASSASGSRSAWVGMRLTGWMMASTLYRVRAAAACRMPPRRRSTQWHSVSGSNASTRPCGAVRTQQESMGCAACHQAGILFRAELNGHCRSTGVAAQGRTRLMVCELRSGAVPGSAGVPPAAGHRPAASGVESTTGAEARSDVERGRTPATPLRRQRRSEPR